MVPDVAKTGHSFNGALAYYLHDKRQEGEAQHPTTADRVAWTATRNLATDDPEQARRIMIATARSADDLKAAAGIKNTGRKSNAHVYAYSLAWHPDEAGNLDRAEMLRAVDQSLKVLGADHLQAVIVCHQDQKHPHAHVILNRVDPATGKMLVTNNDRYKLSDWANEYERERGLIVTPLREEKRQMREAFSEKAQRQDYAQEQRRQASEKPKSRAGMLKEFQDQQKLDHKKQWSDLSAANKDARTRIYGAYDKRIAAAIAMHKAECKPIWAAFFREQRAAQRAFDRGGIIGTLSSAFEAAAYLKATGQDQGKSFLSLAFANTISGQARRAVFEQRQELRRLDMSARLKDVLGNELRELKTRRAAGLAKQRTVFDATRARLIQTQDNERAKIRQAWQQIYTERGKEPARRSAAQEMAAAFRPRKAGPVVISAISKAPPAAPYRREVTPSRDDIAKGLDRKQRARLAAATEGYKPRPSYFSRPAPAPAPAGAGPRPAAKTAAHLPAKTMPEVKKHEDPGAVFRDAAARGVDVPAPYQNASEIRAQYSKAGQSGLEEKRARSRTRSRDRVRVRTRDTKPDNEA